MSRLTEREREAIQQSAVDLKDLVAPEGTVTLSANDVKSKLTNEQDAWLGYGVGAAGLVRAIFRSVILPVKAFMDRRRTVAQLQALDNRMLQDIGLARGDITRYVENTSETTSAEVAKQPTLRQILQTWRLRRETIKQLQGLSPRMLADIGIEPSTIEDYVDEHLAAQTKLGQEAARQHSTWDRDRFVPGDRATLTGYGAIKSNLDWVPEVLAQQALNRKTAA